MCVAIATAFCIAKTIITYDATVLMLSQYVDFFKTILSNPESSLSELQNFLQGLQSNIVGINVAGILSDFETFSSFILGGLFSLGVYKNYAYKKVEEIRSFCIDNDNLRTRFEYTGGVSGGMAFLGVILMLAITSIIEAIPIMMFFMSL